MKFIMTSKYLVQIKYLKNVYCDEEELSFKFTDEFKQDQDEHFFVWSKNIEAVRHIYKSFYEFLNNKNEVIFDLDYHCDIFSVYD